jgi:hypothetical protein
MGYTKIIEKEEWENIVTEDIDVANKRVPLLVIGRFKCYSLRITYPDYYDTRKIAFVIEGNIKRKERALLFLKINLAYNSVESANLKRNIEFDGELAYYLKMALLVRLRNIIFQQRF